MKFNYFIHHIKESHIENSTVLAQSQQIPSNYQWLDTVPASWGRWKLGDYLKNNVTNIEQSLETMTVQQLATSLNISHSSLKYHLSMQGIEVKKIKHNYALRIIKALLVFHPIPEIKNITGFSEKKIARYRKELASEGR